MLKLATLVQNPGEPAVESRYHDAAVLRDLGYNGRVLFETTGLSGVASPEVVVDGEMRRWVQGQFDAVARKIEAAMEAGLEVYILYDVLVLATDVVARNVAALTCKNRPTTLCPASEAALRQAFEGLEAMVRRWPGVAGVVLRFGDTDADRLPYLIGNDLYTPHCPRCSQFGRADRVVEVLSQAHGLVVNRLGKRLIARAWNVRPQGMHDAPELAERVVARLPGEATDDRFVLSFKFTQTDFWRYQPWNPSSLRCGSLAGGRPVIYELQCQREFEGKGGVPNWQAGLWRDGAPETREKSASGGLAEAADAVNFAGVLAWVRGGGWGGPFVKNETWIDANVYAAPRLADDPKADVSQIARDWVKERVPEADEAAGKVLVDVLERSAEMVRQAFYIGPFARQKVDPWHPSADWVQDDLLDAKAAWRMLQRLNDAQLDAAVAEKEDAARTAAELRYALQQHVGDRAHPQLGRLVNTLIYTESLLEALRDLLAGLAAYRRYQKQPSPGLADAARRKLFEAQAHWNHHAQRHGSLPGTATAFRESNFWELTQDILGEIA